MIVRWRGSVGATHYRIERATTEAVRFLPVDTLNATSELFPPKGPAGTKGGIVTKEPRPGLKAREEQCHAIPSPEVAGHICFCTPNRGESITCHGQTNLCCAPSGLRLRFGGILPRPSAWACMSEPFRPISKAPPPALKWRDIPAWAEGPGRAMSRHLQP